MSYTSEKFPGEKHTEGEPEPLRAWAKWLRDILLAVMGGVFPGQLLECHAQVINTKIIPDPAEACQSQRG